MRALEIVHLARSKDDYLYRSRTYLGSSFKAVIHILSDSHKLQSVVVGSLAEVRSSSEEKIPAGERQIWSLFLRADNTNYMQHLEMPSVFAIVNWIDSRPLSRRL